MKKIFAASMLLISLVGHASSDALEPTRVQLLTDNPKSSKGDQLVFEAPDGCFFMGSVNDQRLVVINRKICPGVTTSVSMVVPLDRTSAFDEALNNKSALDWLTMSSRNYYLFPVEAAVDAGTNRKS